MHRIKDVVSYFWEVQATRIFQQNCAWLRKTVQEIYDAKIIISNGNRTEWSRIRSVIIRVITKSVDREAGVRFVYHE